MKRSLKCKHYIYFIGYLPNNTIINKNYSPFKHLQVSDKI